jgi:metallo-beta-lactamase family protein
MRITFLGAAGEVTGSQHLIETRDLRILLDCGFFQGPRAQSRTKNEQFHCRPKALDGVILSHAHIDHCGNLPGLYRAGFRGPVFSTEATADIAELMLLDSAKIQAEDARYLSRRLAPGHPGVEPLYDEDDVHGIMRKFHPLAFHTWHELAKDCKVRFVPAGHILGSAITELEIKDGQEWKKIVFTGDIGRRGMPLLVDPEPVDGAQVLITEATYGNEIHPPPDDIKTGLQKIITATADRGGRVIIPAFSLGRTQQVVYYLNELFNAGQLPRIPIFVDSPLANRVTKVFGRYFDELDDDVQHSRKTDSHIFEFPGLTYVESQQQSISLNRLQGPCVIISASGMCESGRVVHHIKHSLPDDRNTIVLIGYQAPGTLGWRLKFKQQYIRIFDRDFPLRAEVIALSGLSAHADITDLKWWIEQSAAKGNFSHAFIVHAEADGAAGMATLLRDNCDLEPVIPQFRQTFEV